MRYFLSLGSNLGNRNHNLDFARDLLVKRDVKILKSSSIYETQPVEFLSQPWFLNQVLEIETGLLPERLLVLVKDIEKQMGREGGGSKGPRLIDIDILLAGKTIFRSADLTIPHPRLHQRKFVLVPMKEIAPECVHPVIQSKIKVLEEITDDSSVVRIYERNKTERRKRLLDPSK